MAVFVHLTFLITQLETQIERGAEHRVGVQITHLSLVQFPTMLKQIIY
jgi:hypothetical protein